MSAAAATSKLKLGQPPRRVLVIVTRRIGDVLLGTPVVRSLKRAWPKAEIDLLVFAGTEGFVAANRDVAHVLTVAERPRLIDHVRFLMKLARRYDLAISLVPGDRPTWYAFVAGRLRAGLLHPTRKDRWKRALLDAWTPFDNLGTHTVHMHLALLEVLGVAPEHDVVVSWSPEDERAAQALIAELGASSYAVLHPYPKYRYKMWTETGWIDLARWLAQRGLKIVLTGGPEAAEREYVRQIAVKVPGALDLAGKLALGGVGYLISRAAVYVGPDTAVTHAAAALGVPTVALFGPSDPVKWGPWPGGYVDAGNPWTRKGSQAVRRVRLVQGRGLCVPCREEGCERHVASASDCLQHLPVGAVMAAVTDVMG